MNIFDLIIVIVAPVFKVLWLLLELSELFFQLAILFAIGKGIFLAAKRLSLKEGWSATKTTIIKSWKIYVAFLKKGFFISKTIFTLGKSSIQKIK